ncbi:MAG: RNA polymerase sigma factor, partial [Gaiellaceae bacterium]
MAAPLRRLRLEREFERLYRRHRRDVYRAVLRDVRDAEEAEDVTQIAFLDAYRALQRGDEPIRPRAWLLTIAQNAVRRRYRTRALGPREVELQAELLVAPDETGPSAVEIRQAFARLTPSQRKALVLREIAGRSYAEIAATLDLTVPAVETLLFRARRALRVELTGWEPPARRRRLGGLLVWPPAPLGDAAG